MDEINTLVTLKKNTEGHQLKSVRYILLANSIGLAGLLAAYHVNSQHIFMQVLVVTTSLNGWFFYEYLRQHNDNFRKFPESNEDINSRVLAIIFYVSLTNWLLHLAVRGFYCSQNIHDPLSQCQASDLLPQIESEDMRLLASNVAILTGLAILEELFFRGFLTGIFMRLAGAAFAAAASSFAFSAAHGPDSLQGWAMYFFAGLLFWRIATDHGLGTAAATHALMNITVAENNNLDELTFKPTTNWAATHISSEQISSYNSAMMLTPLAVLLGYKLITHFLPLSKKSL